TDHSAVFESNLAGALKVERLNLSEAGGNVPHSCETRGREHGKANILSVKCGSGRIAIGGGVWCNKNDAHSVRESRPEVPKAKDGVPPVNTDSNGQRSDAPNGWLGMCREEGKMKVWAVCCSY